MSGKLKLQKSWITNVVRDGNKIMDQPMAPAPHLDQYQNDEARVQFHKDNPILDSYWMTMDSNMSHLTEPAILMGQQDTE